MSGIESESGEAGGDNEKGEAGGDGLLDTDGTLNRKQATLATAPFVAIGLADVVLLLFWGLDPLWGFVILPPILFVSVIGWIAFRSGFVNQGEATPGPDSGSGSMAEPDPDLDTDGEDAA